MRKALYFFVGLYEVVKASEVSKRLKTEKVVVVGESLDVEGMDRTSALRLKELVDTLVPAERFVGYAVIDGKYVVFKRDGSKIVMAVVEENRVRWCLNRMRELQ